MDETKVEGFFGTPEYFAPEIIKNQKYDYRIDWWTLGCLIYEIIYKVPPFKSDT